MQPSQYCFHYGNNILSPRSLQISDSTADKQRVGVVRLSRRAHNPETGGSNPPLDTRIKNKLKVKKKATDRLFQIFSLLIIIRGLSFIHIPSNNPK